ncbi:MAG TPA: porphobilinogen synthase [Pelagibacteraceae bacterium]|nr:porphobilinogen synthase [Pelagibacteraceae bacterium]
MKLIGSYPATRLRRNRKTEWSRRLVSENALLSKDLIWPIFLTDGINQKNQIPAMPGVYRYSVDKIEKVVEKALKLKLPLLALFPHTNIRNKNKDGSEALNENNLVCRALKLIKKNFKSDIGIMCDVALDPYTSHGHDGLLRKNYVQNDATVEILIKQALLLAQMGCDIIAPSDMMDGRIGKIRKSLDKNNFELIQILSYAVKYASNFYGPFRDAVGSKKNLKGDKKNYQMNFFNQKEALREVALDIKEGADFIMVKPGMPYLDVIKMISDTFKIPVFAYQVSGEYSLIKNGIKKKIISENAIEESLVSLKRAGASGIVTYFADYIAQRL